MKYLLSAVFGLWTVVSVAQVHAATITFNNLSVFGNPETSEVQEAGFRLVSSHFHIVSDPIAYDGPDNGTLYIGEEDGILGGDITLSELNGATFRLNFFDVAELFVNEPFDFPNATSVRVTGLQSTGAIVIASFVLDGLNDGAGAGIDFQQFFLSSVFQNLVSVTFSGIRNASLSGGIGLDNINVEIQLPITAVPLPAGVWFMATGLVLMRKKFIQC